MNGCATRMFMTRMACRSVNLSVCKFAGSKHFSTHVDTATVLRHMRPSSPMVLDLTLGEGEIAQEILQNTSGDVVGIDCDPTCMETISRLKKDFGDRFTGYLGKWSDLPRLMVQHKIHQSCDLVIMDLGVSSRQLGDKDRGFDMETGGKLDMRFDKQGLTCEQILRNVEIDNLSKILKVYGGVVKSKTIARDILERKFLMEEIETSQHLFEVLKNSHDRDEFWEEKGDYLKSENISKVFLGLRMFVNDELNEMEFAIQLAEIVLNKGGILVCGVGTDLERNALKKYLFRKSATVGEEEGTSPMVKKMWEVVEGSEAGQSKGRGTCMIFRKC